MVQFFCPACFAQVPFGEGVCPECGVVADEWMHEHTFTERLVHALGHPVPTTRMMTILSLKGRADPDAAMPLALCAQAYPNDVVQGLEIIRAIAAIDPVAPQRQGALRNLCGHESALIRAEATRVLAEGGFDPGADDTGADPPGGDTGAAQ